MSPTNAQRDTWNRVLVTGATGLVGNNITRLLAQRNVRVRVLLRNQHDLRALADVDVERVTGDVCDPSSLGAAMEGVSCVIHAAGCVLLGWKNQELHEAVNHQGTRNLAQAAHAVQARLVYVSTINTLGQGTRQRTADEEWSAAPNIACPYVNSKQAAEKAVVQYIQAGLDAVVVHPGLMFGPWDWKPSSGRMLLQVAQRFTPMAPKGGCSICDVRDVAQGIIAAAESAPTGRTYVLAGHNMTYLKLWQIFADIAGGSRPICRTGPLIRIAAGRSGDFWGWLTGHEPDINSAAVKLSDGYHYFSSQRAEQELGYTVRAVEESIRDAWQWFREYGYVEA